MPNKDRIKKSYDYFCDKEKRKEGFKLEQLAKHTGWQLSTVKTYTTKKWDWFLKSKEGEYYVEGVSSFAEDEYIRMMSQKDSLSNQPKKPMLPLEVERLVIKARESATLALDIYNRPATMFRTEGFIVMMVIAWTALFHAIFQKRGVKYFHKDSDGIISKIDGESKTWELKECINRYFGDIQSPIRKNLEFFIGLRNKIEHRFVPAIDNHVVGECQALLLNFDDLISDQFTNYYAINEYLAVSLQTASTRTEQQIEAIKKFQGEQYKELKDYIDTFREGLKDAVYSDPKYSFRVFLIPKLGNHEKSSEIAFEFVKYDEEHFEEIEELN